MRSRLVRWAIPRQHFVSPRVASLDHQTPIGILRIRAVAVRAGYDGSLEHYRRWAYRSWLTKPTVIDDMDSEGVSR